MSSPVSRHLLVLLAFASFGHAQPVPVALPAADILHALQAFARTGRVLYVAAHPDDENTRLIAYFARGRHYRTGYLSLTRGDGGQNLIGSELGPALGVIRTQELLAARRIDSGRQFFTRAKDFGFSKTPEETLSVWDRDQVLADIVRVIRSFRPDVIITRFSPEAGGTHGHHTASAQLALEAFRLAADPAAFADELSALAPWRAVRVLWNTSPRRAGVTTGELLTLDVGGFDPVEGESFGEIAARSRTMHKSQGFGSIGTRGRSIEHFQLLGGKAAATDVMDGIDTSWGRAPGGEVIGALAARAIETFAPLRPAASVPVLLDIRRALLALPAAPLTREKLAELDRILAACLGLHVQTTLAEAETLPGETLALQHTVIVRSESAVTWEAVRFPTTGAEIAVRAALAFNEAASADNRVTLPARTPLTQPYWLRAPGTTGMFRVTDAELIGRPESPPPLPVEFSFLLEDQVITVTTEPVQVIDHPIHGEVRRGLRVVPPVSLSFTQRLELLAPRTSRKISVALAAAREGASGRVRLEAPPGWRVAPSDQPFSLRQAGERTTASFTVTAPAATGPASLVASANVGGAPYRTGRTEIRHHHIPPQLIQDEARLKVASLSLATRGRRIGYLAGAGDQVAESLERMGYEVTQLSLDDLVPDLLGDHDAVVLGVRVFNTRDGIATRLPALFAYAEAGGTVIVQYNTTAGLKTGTLAPYPLRLSRHRVTEEDAVVTLLAPEHPALTTPNRITPEDFDGWVQERGLYFPDQWDERFTPLVSAADTGEPQRAGGLLVARHGRGWFVYTGLSFFRQLPEGVPGAYRLFANLVSLGSDE